MRRIARRLYDDVKAQLEATQRDLRASQGRLQHLGEENEELRRENTAQRDHVIVLAGDRDRLTAALETCTRRLASPTADKDPARGGWRSANRTLTPQDEARG